MYPGDKPAIAITLELIIPSPSKITFVSPKLVVVSSDEHVPVPDNEAELERLVESDEIICFGSRCSVIIPQTFCATGISTVGIVPDNPVHHIDPGALHNDKKIVAEKKR